MDKCSVGDSFVHELTMVIEDIPKSYLIQECHDKINDTCTIHPILGLGARISLRESLINKLKTLMTDPLGESVEQALETETETETEEQKLEGGKMLLKLKREKRLRKTEMTKTRHHMEKLCITPKDVIAIEKDIELLWSLLESTLEILDELCVVYLERGEVTNQKAAMEEAVARIGNSIRNRESPRGREITCSNFCRDDECFTREPRRTFITVNRFGRTA
ncbi:hypothetical protein OS493_024275 [Desmophyllum pertusum]|uniref:Uncharacterized protein n=1 Tax=Desmophyllum pertusum TaxID=174260 RepID=A0A9W9YZI4_9CNID|nr:hypothetical protein OS493_024275 [Desmophyllum pertusum]